MRCAYPYPRALLLRLGLAHAMCLGQVAESVAQVVNDQLGQLDHVVEFFGVFMCVFAVVGVDVLTAPAVAGESIFLDFALQPEPVGVLGGGHVFHRLGPVPDMVKARSDWFRSGLDGETALATTP